METDEDRNLRRGGIAGAIGVAAAVVWGIYILAGIAISGYTLGRNAVMDLLAVVPPVAAGAVLAYGAVVALRDARREDWLVRVIAVTLFLIQGALGVSLFGYAAWAGSRVVFAHATRAVARHGSSTAAGESRRPHRPNSTESRSTTIRRPHAPTTPGR